MSEDSPTYGKPNPDQSLVKARMAEMEVAGE